MKKKNIIGHMAAPQESAGGRLRGMALLPRALCLLLAILIWLVVVQANTEAETGDGSGADSAAQLLTEGDMTAG